MSARMKCYEIDAELPLVCKVTRFRWRDEAQQMSLATWRKSGYASSYFGHLPVEPPDVNRTECPCFRLEFGDDDGWQYFEFSHNHHSSAVLAQLEQVEIFEPDGERVFSLSQQPWKSGGYIDLLSYDYELMQSLPFKPGLQYKVHCHVKILESGFKWGSVHYHPTDRCYSRKTFPPPHHWHLYCPSCPGPMQGGVLGDFWIVCQGQRFRCHKFVLSSTSAFMESLLSSGMKEAVEGELIVDDATPDGVQGLLHRLYSGSFQEGPFLADTVLLALKYMLDVPEYVWAHVWNGVVFRDNASTLRVLRMSWDFPDYEVQSLANHLLIGVMMNILNMIHDPEVDLLRDLPEGAKPILMDYLVIASGQGMELPLVRRPLNNCLTYEPK